MSGNANRLEIFKSDLKVMTATEITRKHIIYGDCHALDSDQYYELRVTVAEYFSVHPNEVLVVGSAKLGFSIAPRKSYRIFGDESDIDVVVVCSRLFDQLWEDVFAYSQTGAYWPEKEKFMRYLFMGWIRPDKLPSGEFVDKWWDFFRALTASGKFGDYKVAGAIYKSWFFLESYQSVCVENCIRNGI